MPTLDEGLLDDEQRLTELDSRRTLVSLAMAGAQVRQAVDRSMEAGLQRLLGGERPRAVLVASLGGSALVADVLELLAEPGSPVPVHTRRNVPLPGWVGALDLVVAVSQSGRAPGPVALAAEAARRGAALLTVGAAGSPLAELSARMRGVHIDVPGYGDGGGRVPSSRTSLWGMLTPVVLAGHTLGLYDAGPEVLARVADRLDHLAEVVRPGSESFVNPAKSLALELAEGIPVVLGAGPLAGVSARRASQLLSRTARLPATWGELPDVAAQVVACFDGPYTAAGAASLPGATGSQVDDIFADPFLDGPPAPRLRLLMLRDAAGEGGSGHGSVAQLADAVVQTAREAGVHVSEQDTEPGHPLERLAGHVALTDFAATYLALGLGMDPGVSAHVADLRDRTG